MSNTNPVILLSFVASMCAWCIVLGVGEHLTGLPLAYSIFLAAVTGVGVFCTLIAITFPLGKILDYIEKLEEAEKKRSGTKE